MSSDFFGNGDGWWPFKFGLLVVMSLIAAGFALIDGELLPGAGFAALSLVGAFSYTRARANRKRRGDEQG